MKVTRPSKSGVAFCIFVVGLRARMAPVQAWNFQRTRSICRANTESHYDERTTETDATTRTDSSIFLSTSRRRVLSLVTPTLVASASHVVAWPTNPAMARNLPVSNGADTSKVGTVSTLLPIVKLRSDLESLRRIIQEQREKNESGPLNLATKMKTAFSFTISEVPGGDTRKSATIPAIETEFKRLFDAYSDQVSYKQKFLDQNAFLVYYTKGFDGPGRESLEKDPVNERQTLQFGARNEAWIGWEEFLAEWEYYASLSGRSNGNAEVDDSFLDMIKYLSNAIQAVDRYLKLSPAQDLDAVQQMSS
mmetsp:Transcript_17105/g.39487  ORF Transcript_17105/g.39487 Transcript_17105/m.39487 type:complete len:306 (+) Transcript_17105:32-949(+)